MADTNKAKATGLFYTDDTETGKINELVAELTGALNKKGSPIKTVVTVVPPIRFPIVILDINNYKQAIIVNETYVCRADSLHNEETLNLLPDASIVDGQTTLTEKLPEVKLFEYCRVEDFKVTFNRIYNQMITVLTGEDGNRVGQHVRVERRLNPEANTVDLSIEAHAGRISVNSKHYAIKAGYFLNHYEDNVGYVRNPVLTDVKDIRSFKELALVLTQVVDENFYTRSSVDLTPLKELLFPNLPKKEREWTPEDSLRLMPFLDVSIDIPRTATTLVEQLLLNISLGKPGVEEGFKRFLNEEFGFVDNGLPVFDITDAFEMIYGEIDTKLGVKKIQEITLAEALKMTKNPQDVEALLHGTYASHTAFIKSLNVDARCEGTLKRISFNPAFLAELRRAVASKVVVHNPYGGRERRESYYKLHTRENRFRTGYNQAGYGQGAPGYAAPTGYPYAAPTYPAYGQK